MLFQCWGRTGRVRVNSVLGEPGRRFSGQEEVKRAKAVRTKVYQNGQENALEAALNESYGAQTNR